MSTNSVLESLLAGVFPGEIALHWKPNAVAKEHRYWIIDGKHGLPRWIVPHHAFYGMFVMTQWQPLNWASRVTWAVFCKAYQWGLLGWLPRVRGVGIQFNTPMDWGTMGWQDTVDPIPVIHVGTPAKKCRLIVSLVHPHTGNPLSVVKLPYGEKSAGYITWEATVLKQLGEEKPGVAPALLHSRTDPALSAESFLEGTPAGRGFTPKHITLLKQFRVANETTTLADQAHTLRQQLHSRRDVSDTQRNIIDTALARITNTSPLPTVWVHGDFSAWNMKRTATGELRILDWEQAIPRGLPLLDVIRFFWVEADDDQCRDAQQLKSHPLVQDYMKDMGIDDEQFQQLVLYYIVHFWQRRMSDENMVMADRYFGFLQHYLEVWS